MTRVEIFRDEISKQYMIDYTPESSTRDRRGPSFDTLKEARAAVDERAFNYGADYKSVYVGWR